MGNICLSIHEIEIEMKDKSDIEREREKRERRERRERKKTEEKTRKLYKILSMDGLLI
jgi:hypothetical protein